MDVKKEPLVALFDFLKMPEKCGLEKFLEIQDSCIFAQRKHSEISVKEELEKNDGFIEITDEQKVIIEYESETGVTYYLQKQQNNTGLCVLEPNMGITDIKMEEEEAEDENTETGRVLRDLPGKEEVEDDHKEDEIVYKPRSRFCRNCGETFSNATHFRRHQLSGCGRQTPEETNPMQTKRKSVSERTHSCHVCNKSFFLFQHLKQHLVGHNKDKDFFCDICDKGFVSKRSVVLHQLVHNGKKDHECQQCHKKFARASDLVKHFRSHSDERPYCCDMCHKSFKFQAKLTEHLRVHTGETPHRCDLCPKQFRTRDSLIKHKLTHNGEKPHKCDVV